MEKDLKKKAINTEEPVMESKEEKIKKEVKEAIEDIKAKNPKIRKVFPFLIEGEDGDEKDRYIIYLRQPSLVEFSQYMSLAEADGVGAMRDLAKNCYVGGDKEPVNDENIFLFGLLPNMQSILATRQSRLVNF